MTEIEKNTLLLERLLDVTIHLASRNLNSILAEREEAIYYSVICDSTPDISHTEQNVLLLKYVHQDKNSGVWEITERFLQFKDLKK